MKLLFYIRVTMKKTFSLLFATCVSLFVIGQENFESLSFQKALQKAKKKKKLLFVQLESKTCDQCNEVGKKGLNSADVQKQVDENFIAVVYRPEDLDWKVLTQQHKVTFGSLFFTPSGNLVHKYSSTTTMGNMYVLEMNKALQKRNDFKEYEELQERFQKGDRDAELTKSLIRHKLKLNLPYEEELKVYFLLLTPDSLSTKENIRFLIQTAPVLESYEDRIMRKDTTLFNLCWGTYELNERIRITQTIISKSRLKAIKEKNHRYASSVANYTYKTYLPDAEAGYKEREKQLLYYHIGVRDTTAIYSKCVFIAERFLLNQSKDSLNKKDSAEIKRLFATAPITIEYNSEGKEVKRSTIQRTPLHISYATQLAELSNYISLYLKDPVKLEKSLSIINKAIELYSGANQLETKARILQKLNRPEEAIEVLEAALEEHRLKGMRGDWLLPKIEALKKGIPLKENEQ